VCYENHSPRFIAVKGSYVKHVNTLSITELFPKNIQFLEPRKACMFHFLCTTNYISFVTKRLV